MAVSKRTRFEVLRRDNYTCRYCRSTEDELTIDHVTPVALGGSDDPSNLVACCKDCNAGKTSTSPDATMVADVAQDAIRWSAAMAKAAEITESRAARSVDLIAWFEDEWNSRGPGWGTTDLPADFDTSVVNFHSLGLGRDALLEAIKVATSRCGMGRQAKWRYFCGICWNKVRELQRIAEDILAAEGGGG